MSEAVKEDPGIPPDPYRLVYIIFYWLGVGTLLPWNFFISVPGKEERKERRFCLEVNNGREEVRENP